MEETGKGAKGPAQSPLEDAALSSLVRGSIEQGRGVVQFKQPSTGMGSAMPCYVWVSPFSFRVADSHEKSTVHRKIRCWPSPNLVKRYSLACLVQPAPAPGAFDLA